MVWAVLQFALPAAVAGADARLEGETRVRVAHVESTSASSCRAAHSAECALCQSLTQHARPAAHPPQGTVIATVVLPEELRRIAPVLVSAAQLPPARAPPLA